MIRQVGLFIGVCASLFLSGCETAQDSLSRARNQTILIETPYVKNARCTLVDRKGHKWKLKRSPNTVVVKNGFSPLNIICRKPKYNDAVVVLDDEPIWLVGYTNYIEEASSLLRDPFGSIKRKYPAHISIWLEPKVWDSEEAYNLWHKKKDEYYKKEARLRKERLEEIDRKRAEANKNSITDMISSIPYQGSLKPRHLFGRFMGVNWLNSVLGEDEEDPTIMSQEGTKVVEDPNNMAKSKAAQTLSKQPLLGQAAKPITPHKNAKQASNPFVSNRDVPEPEEVDDQPSIFRWFRDLRQ